MSLPERLVRVGPWVAGAMFLVLCGATILTLEPWCDEGYTASPAMNLLNHGYMGVSSVEGVTFEAMPGLERHWYNQMPFYPVALAGWFAVAGQGLYQQRIFTLLQAILLLVSIFVLLRRITGVKWLAPLTVSILCLDYFFVQRSSDGRHDMLCACLGIGGMAAYMALRERSGVLAAMAGSAGVVGAAMTHAIGVIFGVQFLYLVLYYDRRRIRWSWVMAAIFPGLVACLLWGLYILQDPADFRGQFFRAFGGRAGFLTDPLGGMIREFQTRYLFALGGIGESPVPNPLRQVRAILLAVYLAGMAVVFASRTLRQKLAIQPVIHLWALGSLVLLVLDTGSRTLYLLHILPWMAAMLAAGFGWVWEQKPRMRMALAAVTVVFLVVQAGGVGYRVKRNEWDRVYRPVARYLQERLRPGELVMAGPEWGFAIGFGPQLMDDTCLGYFSKKVPAYLVLDPRYRSQIAWYRKAQPEIFRFVQNRVQNEYQLVTQVDAIEVYQIKSDRAAN